MKRIIKIFIIFLFVLIFVFSFSSCTLISENVPTASRNNTVKHMDAAEVFFKQKLEIFEEIAPIMAERDFVSVDYSGVIYRFIQEKETLEIPEHKMLNKSETESITRLFDGNDYEQLKMLKVSSNGHEAEFCIYVDGQFEILIIKNPNSIHTPKTMYEAFRVKHLTDDWLMLAIDDEMSTEELFKIYDSQNEISEALNISAQNEISE